MLYSRRVSRSVRLETGPDAQVPTSSADVYTLLVLGYLVVGLDRDRSFLVLSLNKAFCH